MELARRKGWFLAVLKRNTARMLWGDDGKGGGNRIVRCFVAGPCELFWPPFCRAEAAIEGSEDVRGHRSIFTV